MSRVPHTGHRVVPQAQSARAAVLRELMTTCEGNYLLLARLAPAMRKGEGRDFCVAGPGGRRAAVSVRVLERGPFTTVLALAEAADGGWLAPLAAEVRVYHDARLAEVVEVQGRRRLQARYAYPNPAMHQPDEKLQANRFLGEWLRHCLQWGEAPLPDACRA